MSPFEAILKVASATDKAILFHSATGKDSIALLDMIRPHFKDIICVYMYIVPNLEHINKYILWAENRYSVQFIQTLHYALPSYIKSGNLGMRQNGKVKNYTLGKITDSIRMKTGIEWVFYGFKQSDGLNRRLMLRTYEGNCICEKTKKCYPLSEWKNRDVLAYIRQNDLIEPINYGKVGSASSGCAVNDINFLLWCKRNHHDDYRKVIKMFPITEQKVFEYEYHERKRAEAKL
ncbi:MAG: phosphoadenosine phosphosulfate reductase family protein [Dysgonamonadaceae bacterium]|nr:phosphoadenosine phosphosulfate reductase family protein [Dysgonamonadaceae bacterium]